MADPSTRRISKGFLVLLVVIVVVIAVAALILLLAGGDDTNTGASVRDPVALSASVLLARLV